MRNKFLFIMLSAFITELLITYFIATFFSVRMIEVMFFTGIAFTVIIFFFTSGGGIFSNMSASKVSASTGIVQKNEPFHFKRGPIFMASILLLIIGLILFVLLVGGIIAPAQNG